jgi:two-component system, LytTR family, sensor kinase
MTKKAMIFRHIFIWLIFISYEMAYINFMVGITATVFHYTVFYALNICLFYFNADVILDFSFFKTDKPYLNAICLTTVEIIVYLAIKYGLDYLLTQVFPQNVKLIFGKQYILTNIWRGVYFIGFSIAYWSMRYMVMFKEKNHLMETERLKNITDKLELENKYISAENAYLQNQISPHLLFNSLNFIYNAIHNLSDRAGKGVMLLADIMRYSLLSSEDNRTVPLKKELEQIEKLIELSHLRFKDEFFVNFRKKGKLSDTEILPLILITLVENMIKHGNLGEVEHPALVTLDRKEDILIFKTTNKKRTGSPHPKSGLGLKNIEKRLINHYQERFKLEIQDNDVDFSVTLILNL